MSMENLSSGSVGSLVDESLFGEVESEELLLRRLSPYATLRAGDLSVLLGISHHHQAGGDSFNRKLASAVFDCGAIAEEERSDGESETGHQTADQKAGEFAEGSDVVVNGADIGDLPIQYVVRGLRPHEMPVIGVYVDPRIVPGFRYRIRHIGTDRYLFEGRALTLQSIGLGYGKRMTFTGDTLNSNNNFFWSDSDPNGMAFTLDAVQPGDQMTIYGGHGTGVVGTVKIERVIGIQDEISSKVVNGDVVKHVQVQLECDVTYHKRQSHMMELKLHDMERTTGVAIVIKKKGSRVAALDYIYDVELMCIPGSCTLQVEP